MQVHQDKVHMMLSAHCPGKAQWTSTCECDMNDVCEWWHLTDEIVCPPGAECGWWSLREPWVLCSEDPMYADYYGYCKCEDTFCNFIKYWWRLVAVEPESICYHHPLYQDNTGFCSCATDNENGSWICQWWSHEAGKDGFYPILKQKW